MKKIIVRGPALSLSGYGEHARFVLRSLRKYPEMFDIYLINVPWGTTGWVWEDNEERTWIDQILGKTIEYGQNGGTFDVSVQVQIPNEWEKIAPINIGITAGIESTKMSPQWLEGCLRMDKIITISNHAKYALETTEYPARNNQTGENIIAKTTCPVEVVSYPVKEVEKDKGFKLDLKHDFNFLAVGTYIPRKNLDNTIKWFVEEFFDEEVGLIVKTCTTKGSIRDRIQTEKKLSSLLEDYKGRKCQVYLLHGDMSESEITSLYQHPKVKAFVSLTHGEGFGLPLYEAAYNGLPILAPDWGGHIDFLYMKTKDKKGKIKNKPMFSTVSYDIKPVQEEAVWDGIIQKDSMWCFPKEWHYKKTLKTVIKNYNTLKSQAKKLQKYLISEYGGETQYKKMAESVLGETITTIDASTLPKVSIITSVYDGDEYIEQFLENITSQTIFKDKCELLLIDANSPGNEEKVIQKYIKKFPDNIIYKKLDEDPGIYGVWNIGVELATGEYLTNANLDDRKSGDSLERHAAALMMAEDVDLVYSDMLITELPNDTWNNSSKPRQKYNMAEFSFDNLLRGNMPHAAPMWRKSMHDKYGTFDASYKSAGDWEMWLRSASQGSQFKKINVVTNLYYFNPKGISTNPENFAWKREEEKSVFKKYKKIHSELQKSQKEEPLRNAGGLVL
jgi:glycosyltransferase involved in cell wall biosynthesis|tara:strand:+ start:2199 stop:4217 length:2019 start_codon:yes stop_codon:yes gene_type:complete